jgi:DUF1680 family protein
MHVSVVSAPPAGAINTAYGQNRPPLLAVPLLKLPLGAIRPQGWLKHQLALMVNGMTGRLGELSRFLRPDNGWFGGDNEGWEEQPYWFRGFHDLAILTGDQNLRAEAARWIEAVISSQQDDGYFGARYHKAVPGKNGQTICDLWPHMVMIDALISHYENTQDRRVITLVQRFFRFCRSLPDEAFIPPTDPRFGNWKPFIQYDRAGDMLPHIYWLYNQTGEAWLLDLATRFFQHTKPATGEWLDNHVVHFTQRFRYPGSYYIQSHEAWHLAASEYWYGQHMGTWGQQPRGIFAADEQIRPGKVDPRQGFETCGMVEFAKSFYILGRITGDPLYVDRCEDVMLNHFPAAQTPDLKALHYLTASNQPQLDAGEQHDFFNKGRQISYSPHIYRCCQHNVAMGWPWYAQNLWQATADNGLAAWLYAACDVTARVGAAGGEVTLHIVTSYPFDGAVAITVNSAARVSFPLYLRVPRWCRAAQVSINGQPAEAQAAPGAYIRIERAWADGDRIILTLPMEFALSEWPRTGSVSVDRGPLSYSLKIAERWQRCGGTDAWPEWEVFPASPWNYGLVIDRADPAASLAVTATRPAGDQPWTVDAAPIEVQARARRLPRWQIEDNQTVGELPLSPVRADQPEERVTLIPLGCARLRIACFPVVGGPEAQEWGKSMDRPFSEE